MCATPCPPECVTDYAKPDSGPLCIGGGGGPPRGPKTPDSGLRFYNVKKIRDNRGCAQNTSGGLGYGVPYSEKNDLITEDLAEKMACIPHLGHYCFLF